jgi:hypothetical protein
MTSAAPDILERRAWAQASSSALMHHGACCDRARAWLLGMGRSLDYAASDGLAYAGPRWLARRWAWGPTRWPIAWCDAVRAEAVDCGVFAVFAREIFLAKGIEVYPAQVLRRYAEGSTSHWRRKWAAMPDAFNWIDTAMVFHEVCVVRGSAQEARVYDPTEGFWLEPGIHSGHGAHCAIRAELPEALSWGPYLLVNGQWTELGGR